ncbi:MAG: hypothetical protein M3M97_08695 [Actinomycetota bacterium]|nr:hypothetical protein [Actinomycetota bacterium]
MNTKEKSLDLREKLEGRLLVGDGAMGKLLADRESNRANLTTPRQRRLPHASGLDAHLAGEVIEPIV